MSNKKLWHISRREIVQWTDLTVNFSTSAAVSSFLHKSHKKTINYWWPWDVIKQMHSQRWLRYSLDGLYWSSWTCSSHSFASASFLDLQKRNRMIWSHKFHNSHYSSSLLMCVWPPNTTSPKHHSVFLRVQPRSRIFSLSSEYFWPAKLSTPVKRSRRLLGGSQRTSPWGKERHSRFRFRKSMSTTNLKKQNTSITFTNCL